MSSLSSQTYETSATLGVRRFASEVDGDDSFVGVESMIGNGVDSLLPSTVKLSSVLAEQIIVSVETTEQEQVDPSTTAFSSCCHTNFLSNRLQLLTIRIEKLSGEWSSSDTGLVSLDYTNNVSYSSWWHSEASTSSSDSGVGRGDIRISSEVNIEKSSVCSLNEHLLSRVTLVMNESNSVSDKFQVGKLLAVYFESSELLLHIDFNRWELLLVMLDETTVLLREFIEIGHQNSIVCELGEESVQIDNNTISDDIEASWADNSTWQNVEVVFPAIGDNRVSCVVSSLASCSHVDFVILNQIVDNLSFSFITPLSTHRDINDSVGVNIESNFDLWNSAWCWWNSDKRKLTEKLVAGGHLAFSLENFDLHLSLSISSGGEDLGFLGWDSCVSGDKLGHDSSKSLNTKRKWSDVKEKNVSDISSQNSSLNSSSHSDSLIWINSLRWNFSENLLDCSLNLWHSAHSSDENHVSNLI
ncbi:hypothetical protein GCK72_019328 [Caenorhabditis remanei]|uniref:Uncharacterized protein n=1 Tax=Caenorhabditis remanei TaxID=31234 RepID=A0A6A5GDL8_CAERE|nr:hypothetical protein GCK72_019328 [Caenorhabditis remanei]KAF1752773.1 hypothetical protein GCK72_019328 [Caenorhabditis remanei]